MSRQKKIVVGLALCIVALGIFYKPLVLCGCRIALHRLQQTAQASEFYYDSLQWEGSAIVLRGLKVKSPTQELTVDSVALEGHVDWKSLCFTPTIAVVHPQLNVISWGSSSSSNSSLLFYRSERFKPDLSVLNGVLQFPTSRFYFSFAPEGEKEVLFLSYQPDLHFFPLLKAEVLQQEKQLHIDFELKETDLSRASSLCTFLFPALCTDTNPLCGEVAVEGGLVLDVAEGLKEVTLQGSAQHVRLAGSYIDTVEGSLFYSDDPSQSSACHVQWDEVMVDAQWAQRGVELTVQGDATSVLQTLCPSVAQRIQGSIDVDVQVLLEKEEERLHWSLAGRLVEEPIEAHGSLLWGATAPFIHFQEATLSLPHVQLERFNPWIPELTLHGVVQCEAVLSAEKLEMTLQPESVVVTHPLATVQLSSASTSHLSYLWKSKEFSLTTSLAQTLLLSSSPSVTVQCLEGELVWTLAGVKIPAFTAVCEGVEFQGGLQVEGGKEKLLTLTTTRIDASLEQLYTLLTPAQEPLPVTGHFHSGQKGLVLTLPLNTLPLSPEWTLQGSLSQLTYPLNNQTTLQKGRCEVAFDSKTAQLKLERGEGQWELLDGTALAVRLSRFNLHLSAEPCLDFSLKIAEGKREVAKLEGRAEATSAGWELTLDPRQTHLAGISLQLHKCLLNQQMALVAFDMTPELKCQELYSLATFLQKTGFLDTAVNLTLLQELQPQGKIQTRFFSEAPSHGISVVASSTDLRLQGTLYTPFQLSARTSQGIWTIERLQAGSLFLTGALSRNAEGFSLPQFEGSWKGVALKGSGYFKSTLRQLHCNLDTVKADLNAFFPSSPFKGSVTAAAHLVADFSSSVYLSGEANLLIDLQTPFAVSAQNKKQIRFSYHPQEGFVSEGCDLHLKNRTTGGYLAELKSGQLLLPKEGYFSAQGLQLSLTPAFVEHALSARWLPKSLASLHWEGNLQASGDFQITPSSTVFQGSLNPGRYGWGEKLLTFEQIQLAYDKKVFHLRTKTHIEEQPLWSSLQLHLDQEIYGVLKLFDHPKAEGLQMTFRAQPDGWIVEGIHGSCYGLDCHLKTQVKRKLLGASSLTGEVKVDLARLTQLLPAPVQQGLHPLKLGSGYEWQGDLVLWQDLQKGFFANGTLKGHEFEALGYRFEQMQATLDVNPQKILLSQMKIEEGGGIIDMKKMELTRHNEQWLLHIPQIAVSHLQPSLMRKIGVASTGVKPFIIENFTLAEIRGELGALSTLEGRGHLTFVNQFKKEASLLDLPLEMIKKIGLDLGLLTPVEGELQIELRGDKFYLLSLDHAYSEAKRSEFYLAPSKHLSYIDLSGSVHINLKMRQDVMLKVIEPFTLTIRGSLDKPRYGLQF